MQVPFDVKVEFLSLQTHEFFRKVAFTFLHTQSDPLYDVAVGQEMKWHFPGGGFYITLITC